MYAKLANIRTCQIGTSISDAAKAFFSVSWYNLVHGNNGSSSWLHDKINK